jgi:hypothetical protein
MRTLRVVLVPLLPVGVLAGVVALCIYAGQHPERMQASLTNGDVSEINSRIKSRSVVAGMFSSFYPTK